MRVKVDGLPYYLEYEKDGIYFCYSDDTREEVSIESAIQFETLAKLDDLNLNIIKLTRLFAYANDMRHMV